MSANKPASPGAPAPEATTPPSTDAESGDADVQALRAELEAARKQAAENEDKFLRARAEGENIRRRAESDIAGAHKYAIERFALEMLAVRDSLDRARDVHGGEGEEETGELARMIEGLDLTLRLMDSVFQKFGLVPVEPAAGERFDPERHQAMSTQESNEIAANHVLSTVQKGYLLQERLLRPAMVIVARGVPEPAPKA